MKKYIPLILLLIFNPSLKAADEEFSPTLGEYEKVLDKYKKTKKEIFDLKTWKDVVLVNRKEAKKEIKFTELSKFEQRVFQIEEAWSVDAELELIKKYWDDEIVVLKKPDHVLKEKALPASPKEKAAELKDVERYQKELLKLRKEFATNFEAEIIKLNKDFPDDFPTKEKDLFLKKIKDYHDSQKLIERK